VSLIRLKGYNLCLSHRWNFVDGTDTLGKSDHME
jgi:hypothetical protein